MWVVYILGSVVILGMILMVIVELPDDKDDY